MEVVYRVPARLLQAFVDQRRAVRVREGDDVGVGELVERRPTGPVPWGLDAVPLRATPGRVPGVDVGRLPLDDPVDTEAAVVGGRPVPGVGQVEVLTLEGVCEFVGQHVAGDRRLCLRAGHDDDGVVEPLLLGVREDGLLGEGIDPAGRVLVLAVDKCRLPEALGGREGLVEALCGEIRGEGPVRVARPEPVAREEAQRDVLGELLATEELDAGHRPGHEPALLGGGEAVPVDLGDVDGLVVPVAVLPADGVRRRVRWRVVGLGRGRARVVSGPCLSGDARGSGRSEFGCVGGADGQTGAGSRPEENHEEGHREEGARDARGDH